MHDGVRAYACLPACMHVDICLYMYLRVSINITHDYTHQATYTVDDLIRLRASVCYGVHDQITMKLNNSCHVSILKLGPSERFFPRNERSL